MKTSDVLIGVAAILGVVVVYKMFLAPTPATPVGSVGGVNPTLGGVASIIDSTSGLLGTLGGLFKKSEPKTEEDTQALSARIPAPGRLAIDDPSDALNFRGEAAAFDSGFAVQA